MDILPTLALVPGPSTLPAAVASGDDDPFMALLAGLMQQVVPPSPPLSNLAEPNGSAVTVVAENAVPARSLPAAPPRVAVSPDLGALVAATAGTQPRADQPMSPASRPGRPVAAASAVIQPTPQHPAVVDPSRAEPVSAAQAPDHVRPVIEAVVPDRPTRPHLVVAPTPPEAGGDADGPGATDEPRASVGNAAIVPAAERPAEPVDLADGSAPARDQATLTAAPEIAPPQGSPNPADTRPAPAAQPLPAILLPVPDHRGRPVTARLEVIDAGDGSRVRIDLEPADLGRVEVALRLDDSGAATASFTVERPETLQLLQRDARVVNEILGAAGFTVEQGGLDFSLGDSGGREGGSRPAPQPAWAEARSGSPADAGEPAPSRRRGLLDLQV